MKVFKIILMVILALLAIGILALLIINWTTGFASTADTYALAVSNDTNPIYYGGAYIPSVGFVNYYGLAVSSQVKNEQTGAVVQDRAPSTFISLYLSDYDTNTSLAGRMSVYEYGSNVACYVEFPSSITYNNKTYAKTGLYAIRTNISGQTLVTYSDNLGTFNFTYAEYKTKYGQEPTIMPVYGQEIEINNIQYYYDYMSLFGDFNKMPSTIILQEGYTLTYQDLPTFEMDTSNNKNLNASLSVSGIQLIYANNITQNIHFGQAIHLIQPLAQLQRATLLFDIANIGYYFDVVENGGYDTGYSNGYDLGYDNGHSEGYTAGYTEGDTVGYVRGYNEGKDIGYSDGYQAGATEGINKLPSLQAAALTVKAVFTALDVKIFGFLSILDLLGIVVVMGIVLLVIKFVRG